MRVIVSAGGTGGHIYPALAIIDYFKRHDKSFEVLYIGTHNRMETEIVPKKKIPFESLEIYGLSKNMIKNIKNVKLLKKAYNKALDIIDEFKPDIVIGVGGYVTLPVILAAKKRGIKTALHEQNSIPGKTNKYLAKKVDIVFNSFESARKYFKNSNVIYSGNPSSDSVITKSAMKKETLGLTKKKKLVIVTSGSLGSSDMSDKLVDFLKLSQNNNYEVVFLTGNSYYEEFTRINKFSKDIKVLPYLDNLATLFKSADLVIGRAGAGTISEILAAKVPSILIPSPNVANNHQYYNAKDLVDKNLALMVLESELKGNLLYLKVKDLLDNSDEYKLIKDNLEKFTKESSSKIIYDKVVELINE